MTYQGPQQPWQHPGQQPQFSGAPQGNHGPQGHPGYPPPGGHFGGPAGPGYPPGYPPPPKKKTGLIVGLILGIVVVLVLGVSALFIFGVDSDTPVSATPSPKPASKTDLTKLETACQFLSPEELSAKTGVKGLQTQEIKKSEPDLTSFVVGCNYLLPDGRVFEGTRFRIYQPGTCDPQRCLDVKDFQDAKPVEGVGQKALFFLDNELKRGELFTVEIFGDIPVMLNVIGPGPNITSQELGPLANDILANIGR